jgi:hypothetical protein
MDMRSLLGKKFSHWFSLDTTKELINELEAEAGIPVSGLIESMNVSTFSVELTTLTV